MNKLSSNAWLNWMIIEHSSAGWSGWQLCCRHRVNKSSYPFELMHVDLQLIGNEQQLFCQNKISNKRQILVLSCYFRITLGLGLQLLVQEFFTEWTIQIEEWQQWTFTHTNLGPDIFWICLSGMTNAAGDCQSQTRSNIQPFQNFLENYWTSVHVWKELDWWFESLTLGGMLYSAAPLVLLWSTTSARKQRARGYVIKQHRLR